MSNSAVNKKAKMEEDSDFESVRRYILECPLVPPHHPAIHAALAGLDKAIQQKQRDAKLHQKFGIMQDVVTVEKPRETEAINLKSSSKEHAVSSSNPTEETAMLTDDWHDVTTETSLDDDAVGGMLGQQLAKQVIATLAAFEVRIASALQAVAVALHATLRTLQFHCTGIPEPTTSSSSFAAPVRELPASQFLPAQWDLNSKQIQLRYRKHTIGSVVLDVTMDAENGITVTLVPANTPEPRETLQFSLEEHVNVESLAKALKDAPQVPPALHYKYLAQLLSKFAATFDLGLPEEDSAQALPYVDTTVQNLSTTAQSRPSYAVNDQPALVIPPVGLNRSYNEHTTPTIDDAFQLHRPSHGDFADDLVPGGVTGPLFGRTGPNMGGNVMGPNHPIFAGGGMSGVGPNSGYGMRPRFDPYGPPGGPTDPDPEVPDPRITRPHIPGGTGNPNPDHLRPPNNLNNNNMFM